MNVIRPSPLESSWSLEPPYPLDHLDKAMLYSFDHYSMSKTS